MLTKIMDFPGDDPAVQCVVYYEAERYTVSMAEDSRGEIAITVLVKLGPMAVKPDYARTFVLGPIAKKWKEVIVGEGVWRVEIPEDMHHALMLLMCRVNGVWGAKETAIDREED